MCQMICNKMASRSQMCNNMLPQGREPQAVPGNTSCIPPSLAWSILRQSKSVDTQITSGNKVASRSPRYNSLTTFSHGADSRTPDPEEHVQGPHQWMRSILRRSLWWRRFVFIMNNRANKQTENQCIIVRLSELG